MAYKWTKRRIIFHIVWGLMLIAGFVGIALYTGYVGKHGLSFGINEPSDKFEISLEVSKSWDESGHGYEYGMQYDGKLKNNTASNMSDWEMEIDLVDGCHLDSFWNGKMELVMNKIIVIPEDFTNIIEANNERTFGFILYSHTLENINDCHITVHHKVVMTELLFFWFLVLAVIITVAVDITLMWGDIKRRYLEEKQAEAVNIINQSFLTFANMIDAKDKYTRGHSHRVAIYAKEIARRMGLSEEEQQRLYYIGLLHDIGKIGIPDSILKKDGALTAEERHIIEGHVKIGGNILKDFTAIPGIESGARYHHERYDGTGYQTGAKGEEIPLYGRIICVADAFDDMSSVKCYRGKLDLSYIKDEFAKCSGTQFDPKIVPYILEMIEERKAPVVLDEDGL